MQLDDEDAEISEEYRPAVHDAHCTFEEEYWPAGQLFVQELDCATEYCPEAHMLQALAAPVEYVFTAQLLQPLDPLVEVRPALQSPVADVRPVLAQ